MMADNSHRDRNQRKTMAKHGLQICKHFEQFHVLKKCHTSNRLTVYAFYDRNANQLTKKSPQKKLTNQTGRHLTLVYMRHVTLMLIVESENINSIRALCVFGVFACNAKNLYSRFVIECSWLEHTTAHTHIRR